MITQEAAGLSINIAKGLLKLSHRIDLVLAEKEAVQAPLALPAPNLNLSPTGNQMRKELVNLLGEAFEEGADPLANDRAAIQNVLDGDPFPADMYPYVLRYLPILAQSRAISPNGAFMNALRASKPDWAADPDLRVAAFHIGSGPDIRNKNYTWRIALTVVDVFAEFGAENSTLLSRDEKTQAIVSKILQRFADSDLQNADTNTDLLKSILSATLNGFLDVKDQVKIKEEWLTSLIDAVATARSKADKPDNFVAGLFQGQGYPQLVSSLVSEVASKLDTEDADGFNKATAAFLGDVAEILNTKASFKGFFNDHWGDMIRAAFLSVEKHGPELLKGEDPILGKILSAIAGDLAKRPSNKLLSSDSLIGTVDAIIGTVAANPELIDDILSEHWLATLVRSTVTTVSDTGIQAAFARPGVDRMVKDVFRTYGERPELLVSNPGSAQQLLGGILKSVANASIFQGEQLASAALAGALETVSQNPNIVNDDYPKLVAEVAGNIAGLVKTKKLSHIEGSDLARIATTAIANNPKLLGDIETKLVEAAIGSTMNASEADGVVSIIGSTRNSIVKEVIGAIAVAGKAALKNRSTEEFKTQFEQLLTAGFLRAESELGNRIGIPSLPAVTRQLVISWAQGKIANIAPDDPAFKQLFTEISDRIQILNPQPALST